MVDLFKKMIFALTIFFLFTQNIYANNIGDYIQTINYGDVYSKKDISSKMSKVTIYNKETKYLCILVSQDELGVVSISFYDTDNNKYYSALTMKDQIKCNVEIQSNDKKNKNIDRYVIPSDMCESISYNKDILYLIENSSASDFEERFEKIDELINKTIKNTSKLKEHTTIRKGCLFRKNINVK